MRRYRQIASILGRHGFGFLVDAAGLGALVPFHHGLLGHPRRQEPYTQPEHLRMALEELGPAAIKLGQILSTRADLLPDTYLSEFSKLQDAAPPVPFDAVHDVLVAELDRPLEEVFVRFEPRPLAAASIGQAHEATLVDGTDVVVKVRRPGVVARVEEDLEILLHLAVVASQRWEVAQQYDVVALAQEFAETLRAELDYQREGRHADRFRANFADDPQIHIPQVFWGTTTSQVITLERIRGIKIGAIQFLDQAGVDRQALARRFAEMLLKMSFEDGFLHADPHPGNFFVEPGGRIGVIDFGLVSVIDERTERQLVRLLVALASQDPDRLVDVFLDIGVVRERIDRPRLRNDLHDLVMRYSERPLGEIAIRPLLEETLTLVRRYHLQIPSNLALFIKAAMMAEGLAAQLDPSFELLTVLEPYGQRLLLRQYDPFRWMPHLMQTGLDIAQLAMEFPPQLRRVLAELERGNLEFGMRPEHIDDLVDRAERWVNRLVLGWLAGALLIGLAVIAGSSTSTAITGWVNTATIAALVLVGLILAYLFRSARHARRR